jgi:hypothetical protein
VTGDEKSWQDREKLTFAERDRRRREGGGGGDNEPSSPEARERAQAASKQYRAEIDGLFSGGGKAERENLAAAMRDAHGTPGLADACRAYRDASGMPDDPRLISLFLDTVDFELIMAGFGALRTGAESGTIKLTGSLRSQLRILAEDPADAVAEGAEELLEAL